MKIVFYTRGGENCWRRAIILKVLRTPKVAEQNDERMIARYIAVLGSSDRSGGKEERFVSCSKPPNKRGNDLDGWLKAEGNKKLCPGYRVPSKIGRILDRI